MIAHKCHQPALRLPSAFPQPALSPPPACPLLVLSLPPAYHQPAVNLPSDTLRLLSTRTQPTHSLPSDVKELSTVYKRREGQQAVKGKTPKIRQCTIYYAGLLGRWDKRIVNQESDIPNIILLYFL